MRHNAMKIKILITAMGLGLSLNAFAFFNQPANTGDNAKAPVDQVMTAPVDQKMEAPISQEMSSPASKVSMSQAERVSQIEKDAQKSQRQKEISQAELVRKIEKDARAEEVRKYNIQRQSEMNQIELVRKIEENARIEKQEQARAERRDQKERAQAERRDKIAQQNADRSRAAANAKELVRMRNEGINMTLSLNLVDMPDRLKYKAHYDEMMKLADGDAKNENIADFGIIGARQYFGNAVDYIQTHGQYMFKDREEGRRWGYSLDTSIKKGEYVEIMKTWPARIEKAETMINLAAKYANVDEPVHEFEQFQKYIDWRKGELRARQEHVEEILADPEYNPDDRLKSGYTLSSSIGNTKLINDVTLGDVGTATVDVGKKAVNGIKNIASKCWINCK